MSKYVVNGKEFNARTFSEMEGWERYCVSQLVTTIGLPPDVFVKSVLAVDPGTELPEGFMVLGVCSRDGVSSIRVFRGDRVLAVLNSVPDTPIIIPSLVMSPAKLVEVYRDDGAKASVIVLNMYELHQRLFLRR